tara:strand:+ start:811 stop:1281 length:471 start_codon:yes stop_codon:yes gene_type:complete
MNWQEKKEVKKGDLGQEIVVKILEEEGLQVMTHKKTSGAHWFDIIAARKKEEIFCIDVKTKSRLNKWKAQGIDIKHYKDYMNVIKKYNIQFWLFFVDDKNGDIHAANLKTLKNPIYPNKEIIAWSLDQMHKVDKIKKEEIKKLTSFDTRNYKYNPA